MDHQRVNISTSQISCGVGELSRISSEDIGDVCYAIATRLYHPSRGDPVAFFVFSDVNEKNTNSERLKDYVREKQLGKISVSDVATNPRTGNEIVVYTWYIAHGNFKAWYSRVRVARLRRRVGT